MLELQVERKRIKQKNEYEGGESDNELNFVLAATVWSLFVPVNLPPLPSLITMSPPPSLEKCMHAGKQEEKEEIRILWEIVSKDVAWFIIYRMALDGNESL